MRALLAIVAVVLVAGAGGYGLRATTENTTTTTTTVATTTRTTTTTSSGPAFVPACPHASYGVDGNVAPLFCRIDNPLALRRYSPVVDELILLGPNASPDAVSRLIARAHVVPASWACSAYALAAWAEHWEFGYNPLSYC